jgi:hypothetical protein
MENSIQNGTQQRDSASRNSDRTLIDIVQEQPVVCLAIAAAAGFVLGGGMRRTNGLALLALIGQMAMRDALGNIVNGVLRDNHAG